MQGPESYLVDLGISLPCAVDPSSPAIIDAAHRKLVNHEAYFFSDVGALQVFLAEPYRYTGKVTDPVTLERFIPNPDSPTRSYGERLFFFASETTAARFDQESDRYGVPMPGMREKKAGGE